MLEVLNRCTVERFYCHLRGAGFGVQPVAMVLGKGFLENRTPERTIRTNLSQLSGMSSILVRERKEIVDDDGVRDTHGVEVYGIDTVSARFCV